MLYGVLIVTGSMSHQEKLRGGLSGRPSLPNSRRHRRSGRRRGAGGPESQTRRGTECPLRGAERMRSPTRRWTSCPSAPSMIARGAWESSAKPENHIYMDKPVAGNEDEARTGSGC